MTVSAPWVGSNLAGILARLDVAMAADASLAGLKLTIDIGKAADARRRAAPSITWIDGDDTDEEYALPYEQPDEGKAILDASLVSSVVIRGQDVRRAELLRDGLLRALEGQFSGNAYALGRGRRTGGLPGDQAFTIEIPIGLRVPVLEQAWLQDSLIEAWSSEGYVEASPPASPAPEQITDVEV